MGTQFGVRFYKDQRTILTPVTPPVSPMITWQPVLTFTPGYYKYNADTFDCRSPGLHRFTHFSTPDEPWNNTTNMVITGDTIGLLSAAAWLSASGDKDNGLSVAALTDKARGSKLNLLCGPLHDWAKAALLDPQGIVSRKVYFLTMATPDNVVDGHQALEVTIGSQRVLADLFNNCMFKDLSGNLLSADATVSAMAANAWVPDALAIDAPYAQEVANDGTLDMTAYAEAKAMTPADIAAWQSRIFQGIGMANGSEIWWKLPTGSSGRQAWVESLQANYKVKTAALWNATFYP